MCLTYFLLTLLNSKSLLAVVHAVVNIYLETNREEKQLGEVLWKE